MQKSLIPHKADVILMIGKEVCAESP